VFKLKTVFYSLSLSLSLSLVFASLLIPNSFLFAEDITITTYYPSPYGEYNELGTNRLSVGDTNNDGNLDAADQPNRDGDIRIKPQAGDPTGWPAGTTGQFSYSNMNDSLYHYNGSAWVASGGGGASYVDYSMAAGKSVGSACSVSGFTIKGDLGSWGYCGFGAGSNSFFRPPGSGCPFGGPSGSMGEAYVCSQ